MNRGTRRTNFRVLVLCLKSTIPKRAPKGAITADSRRVLSDILRPERTAWYLSYPYRSSTEKLAIKERTRNQRGGPVTYHGPADTASSIHCQSVACRVIVSPFLYNMHGDMKQSSKVGIGKDLFFSPVFPEPAFFHQDDP